MRIYASTKTLQLVTAAWLVATSANVSADGLDALRDVAKEASARGDYAAAVANLRRARRSVLAEGHEVELRLELGQAEAKWLGELIVNAAKTPLDSRISALLELRSEATRIGNAAAVTQVDAAIESAALMIWARDQVPDDARTLSLAAKLRNAARNAPLLETAIRIREAAVEQKISGFSVAGIDGDYVRDRLRYAFALRAALADDPHPVDLGLVLTASDAALVGTLGSQLRIAIEARRGTNKVELQLGSLTSKTTATDAGSSKTLTFTETYEVHETERVSTWSKRMVQMGTQAPTCTPTYYKTTQTTHTEANGSRYSVQNYAESGQNCFGGGAPIMEEQAYETVEFVPTTRIATRTATEVVSLTTRVTSLAYLVKASFQVPGQRLEVSFDDKVAVEEERYQGERSKQNHAFSTDVDAQLASAAAGKITGELSKLAIQTTKAARQEALRHELTTTTGAARDRVIAELASSELVPAEDVVARIAVTSSLPAKDIASALSGRRNITITSYEALSAGACCVLPAPDADADKIAFVSEEREYVRRTGSTVSGGLYFGMGSVQLPGASSFLFGNINLGINKTPSFLLFRTFTGAAFLEANLGIGKVFPINAVVGISAGIRVGPANLSVLGVVGTDAIFINRGEESAKPNDPELSPALLYGYGGRLTIRTELINILATVRRHHRLASMPSVPNVGYIGDLRIGRGPFYLGARYEAFRELLQNFSGNTSASDSAPGPWSFIGSIGVQFDFGDSKVGELQVRKPVAEPVDN